MEVVLLNNSGDPDDGGKTAADGQEGREAVLPGLRSEDMAVVFATVNEPFGGTQPLQSPKQTLINILI